MNTTPQWAIKPLVPDEIYTDRQEFLDYFYEYALKAITRRAMSTVLLGQRRMGKTEIFKRVVNRLFFEQDHEDPHAVVPVFFTFPYEIISREHFALKYVENFVRWYAAFRLQNTSLLKIPSDPQNLLEFVQQHLTISKGFEVALDLMTAIGRGRVILPEMEALHLPRTVSSWDDTTIVMFLDEFQNTHLPEYNFRVVGFMQEAVESPTCPHFVTGSAMSILRQEILGRGALFGRFMSEPIEAFTDYYGAELAMRAARYYGTDLGEVMAPVISERCGGNPFYITSVIRQASRQRKTLYDEATLNEMLAVDLSSGFIWAELHDQITRWIAKVNEYGITKWILYLAALEKDERINLQRIQEELRQHKKQEVDLTTIKETLVKLSRGDIIEYKSFGDWFGKVNDPILEEFLKVWGRIEVLGDSANEVKDEIQNTYQRLQKRFSEYKGYLGEVFMIQILYSSQRSKLPGQYFHAREEISVPQFNYIDQRSRLGAGKGLELDVYAAVGIEVWIAQSKWWSGRKVDVKAVEHLLQQAEIVRQRKGDNLETLRLWLFAHDGVTKDAEQLMQTHQVLWSTRKDLDALLEHVHLRKLPVLDR